jgi:hypothetical protein
VNATQRDALTSMALLSGAFPELDVSKLRRTPEPPRTTLSTPLDRVVSDLTLGSEEGLATDLDELRFAWDLAAMLKAGIGFAPSKAGILVTRDTGTLELVAMQGEDYESLLRRAVSMLGRGL